MYCVACSRPLRRGEEEWGMSATCKAKWLQGIPALVTRDSLILQLPASHPLQGALPESGSAEDLLRATLAWISRAMRDEQMNIGQMLAAMPVLRSLGQRDLAVQFERGRYGVVLVRDGGWIDVFVPYNEQAKDALKAIPGRRASFYETQLSANGQPKFRCWTVPQNTRQRLMGVLRRYFAGSYVLENGQISQLVAEEAGDRGVIQAALAPPVTRPGPNGWAQLLEAEAPVATPNRTIIPAETARQLMAAADPAPLGVTVAPPVEDPTTQPPRWEPAKYGMQPGDEMLYLGRVDYNSQAWDAFYKESDLEYRAYTESGLPGGDLRCSVCSAAQIAATYNPLWRAVYSRHNEARYSGGFSLGFRYERVAARAVERPVEALARFYHMDFRSDVEAAPAPPARPSKRFAKLDLD